MIIIRFSLLLRLQVGVVHLVFLSNFVGFTYSGIGPDYRVLVTNARKSSQKYYLTYREVAPVVEIARDAASLMQEYTQSGGVRPFGVSLLVAGYDHDGPQLFQVDPSGMKCSFCYFTCIRRIFWMESDCDR
jgi:20S proteasome subunit alpha 2